MGILQTTKQRSSGSLGCPECDATLPPHAVFCGSCGHRVVKEQNSTSLSRYRITSLVRRLPYISLFFAIDTQQQRIVAIRDIDISSLDKDAQEEANTLSQNEYDLLRQQSIADIMPVIDVQQNREHLFTITGQPSFDNETAKGAGHKETTTPLHTLQDFLQSGIGLPSQQIALSWITRLCQATEKLHRHQIIIGDLDPHTIVLNGDDYLSQPTLMVSWLLPQIRTLLSHSVSEQSSPTTQATPFSAPEILLGRIEPTADVYSLGAILYLLLTGTPPDEPMQRTHHRMRTPRELNPRISSAIDEIVMCALSFESSERFQSVQALAEALSNRRTSSPLKATAPHPPEDTNEVVHISGITEMNTISMTPSSEEGIAEMDTISMTPLSEDSIVEMDIISIPTLSEDGQLSWTSIDTLTSSPAPTVETTLQLLPEAQDQQLSSDEPESPSYPLEDIPPSDNSKNGATSAAQSLKQKITTILPAIPRSSKRNTSILPAIPHLSKRNTSILPAIPRSSKRNTSILPAIPTQAKSEQQKEAASAPPQTSTPPFPIAASLPVPDAEPTTINTQQTSASGMQLVPFEEPKTRESLLKRIQRIILGQQQLATTAPAIIEAPLRIRPSQEYSIRLRLIGRDEAVVSPQTKKGLQSKGLSTYIHGELIHIEVRSAFYQSYTYFVQQAAVNIPPLGYVAEVIMPMQPFATKSDGRRERLHIFFLDKNRRPLYEKPFVIELFVSRLIPHGREGHHLLPIPL